jgi:hypothetical protein
MKTQSDLLIVLNEYPQHKTLSNALDEALKMSKEYKHLFIYVRYSTTTGQYSIDLIGNQYLDSKIVATYFNQQKTL